MPVTRTQARSERSIVGALVLMLLAATSAAADDTEDAVVAWLDARSVPLETVEAGHGFDDLQPLRAAVGDARIVSLGESTHGTREAFQMKHRMLEFLVEEMGFTIFGIEASYPDCVAINDYVQGGDVDPEVALHGQGFWTWDTEEVLALVRWMRAYNADPAHRTRLHFYGFDMQSAAPAAAFALSFLDRHDPERARDLRGRLEPLVDPLFMQQYADLPPDVRDQAKEAAAEIVTPFAALERHMIGEAARREWSTARQHAVVVRQCEEMTRTMHEASGGIGMQRLMQLETSIAATCTSLLEYLDYVDAELAEDARPLLEKLAAAPGAVQRAYRDETLDDDRATWDLMSARIIEELHRRRGEYMIGSNPDAWPHASRSAADVATYLQVCRERANMPAAPRNVRDVSMAENVAWILERHGPDAKIVTWAHNGHVSHEPVERGTGPMGAELQAMFGDDHLVFGFSFNQGEFQAIHRPSDPGIWDGGPSLRPFTVGPAEPGSVDRVFAGAASPRYVIDLRTAPDTGPVAAWLATPRPLRMIGAVFTPEHETSFYRIGVLPEHYDVVIFLETTTRARPTRLTREKFGMPEP